MRGVGLIIHVVSNSSSSPPYTRNSPRFSTWQGRTRVSPTTAR